MGMTGGSMAWHEDLGYDRRIAGMVGGSMA